MADDDRRVEVRVGLVGRGSATTPERIDELARRARELEKLARGKSTRSFAALVDRSPVDPSAASTKKPARSKRERELKKTPRPGLVHPAQRATYGREDGDADPIVLKG